jgi:hypothetical protein
MANDRLDGLLMKGSVAGRARRVVGDKKIELITYKILAGTKVYFVKDWVPNSYFSVGETVELPISIKPFQKNGHISLDYTIRASMLSGEEF